MNIDAELVKICGTLDELQAELAASLPENMNPLLGQAVSAMRARLADERATFVEAFKTASAQADEKIARVKQDSLSLLGQIVMAEQKLAEPLPPVAPPAPAKRPAVDRTLGQKLRQELIERFAPPGRREVDPSTWDLLGEAWDDWAGWSQN